MSRYDHKIETRRHKKNKEKEMKKNKDRRRQKMIEINKRLEERRQQRKGKLFLIQQMTENSMNEKNLESPGFFFA